MATLAGTLTDVGLTAWDGQMRVRLTTAPADSTNSIRAGSKLFIPVDAGDYSQDLAPGIYGLNIPGCPEFYIAIPDTVSSYAIDDLIYTPPSSGSEVVTGISYFRTLAEFRSDTTNQRLAFLSADLNGDFGWYEAAGDTNDDDGVNYVHNMSGVVYTLRT